MADISNKLKETFKTNDYVQVTWECGCGTEQVTRMSYEEYIHYKQERKQKMGWRKFEGCSLQELAKGMGVTAESLSKVPIKKIEEIYQNFITWKDSENRFHTDKIVYCLEELKRDE